MNKDDFKKNFLILAKKLDLPIKNINLYFNAFTHPSYANEHKVPNNERLEYLGDAILDFLVAEYLYNNYPDINEGELSKIRSKYVCSQANFEYAKNLGLDNYVLLGKGEKVQGGEHKQSVVANLFETFLAAVYLDLGLKYVSKLLEEYVFPNILYQNDEYFIDYKSRLQEYIQAESREGVIYTVENETGPNHDKTFVVSVYHDKLKLGTGKGKSKKEAEQKAAEDALSKCIPA